MCSRLGRRAVWRSAIEWHTSIFVRAANAGAVARGGHRAAKQGHRYRSPPTEYPHFNAAYGQYYYLRKPQAVFKVPDNVPDVLAGPANCALSQVIDGLERAAVGPGDSLVIQGAGGLGINAVAVAKERGVSQVIVIDGIDSRLELADEFGADVTIDLKEFKSPDARVKRVRELTRGTVPTSSWKSSARRPSLPRESRCCATAARILKSAISISG